MRKKTYLIFMFLLPLIGAFPQSGGVTTNSFFDNDASYPLGLTRLKVEGEVVKPGFVEFEKLPLHSMIVKEALPDSVGNPSFVGAYKYTGYSLADILNPFIARKENATDFPPLTDLYVEISNEKGDIAIISWGEIFYSNQLHPILLATEVMPIIPEKSKDQWPIPRECKIVVGHDLAGIRNISMPVSITVKTLDRKLSIEKGKFPLTAGLCRIYHNEKQVDEISSQPDSISPVSLHTIFYGKGRGLHSMEPVSGFNMQSVLSQYLPFSKANLQTGMVLIAAEDGYRAMFSLSELCNRADQQATLLLVLPEKQGRGKFRIYPSCDFFSDRAVKGVSDIWIITQN